MAGATVPRIQATLLNRLDKTSGSPLGLALKYAGPPPGVGPIESAVCRVSEARPLPEVLPKAKPLLDLVGVLAIGELVKVRESGRVGTLVDYDGGSHMPYTVSFYDGRYPSTEYYEREEVIKEDSTPLFSLILSAFDSGCFQRDQRECQESVLALVGVGVAEENGGLEFDADADYASEDTSEEDIKDEMKEVQLEDVSYWQLATQWMTGDHRSQVAVQSVEAGPSVDSKADAKSDDSSTASTGCSRDSSVGCLSPCPGAETPPSPMRQRRSSVTFAEDGERPVVVEVASQWHEASKRAEREICEVELKHVHEAFGPCVSGVAPCIGRPMLVMQDMVKNQECMETVGRALYREVKKGVREIKKAVKKADEW